MSMCPSIVITRGEATVYFSKEKKITAKSVSVVLLFLQTLTNVCILAVVPFSLSIQMHCGMSNALALTVTDSHLQVLQK